VAIVSKGQTAVVLALVALFVTGPEGVRLEIVRRIAE
jgi:hypothetical protein